MLQLGTHRVGFGLHYRNADFLEGVPGYSIAVLVPGTPGESTLRYCSRGPPWGGPGLKHRSADFLKGAPGYSIAVLAPGTPRVWAKQP